MDLLTVGAFVFAGAASALAAAFYLRVRAEKSRADDLASKVNAKDVELAALREKSANAERNFDGRAAELTKLQQDANEKAIALSDARSALSAASAERDALQCKFDERMKEFDALKAELDKARAEYAALMERCAAAEKKLASADSAREEERRAFDARIEDLRNLRKEMEAVFAKLSGEALSKSSEQFLNLAGERLAKLNERNFADLEKNRKAVEELVKPLNDAIGRVGERVEAFDKNRAESFTKMAERLTTLAGQEENLRRETAALGEALRKPSVRGAWGEMQLRRVVEFAGMVEHCNFDVQVAVSDADRPDMVVHLPNGASVVVDAKAPMQAYLEALLVSDAAKRDELLRSHVRQIRDRAKKLAQKKYTDQFKDTPDFTVMFLPAESLFSTALEIEPGLLDEGIKDRVIYATPTTLIALLMAVAAGWQDRKVAENARLLRDECAGLYDGVCKFLEHYESVGRSLEKAVGEYNKSVGSLQRNYLPKARRINELGGFDADGERLIEATPEEISETAARRLDLPGK